MNSWPLDEGLIDYVDSGYGTTSDSNPYYTLNVIANPSLKIGFVGAKVAVQPDESLRQGAPIDFVPARSQ